MRAFPPASLRVHTAEDRGRAEQVADGTPAIASAIWRITVEPDPAQGWRGADAHYRAAMSSELSRRLTIGPLLGGLFVAAVTVDFLTERHFGVLVLLLIGIPLGCRELQRMAREVTGPVQIMPTLVISLFLIVAAYITEDPVSSAFLHAHSRYLIDRLQDMPLTAVLLAIGMLWTILIQMSRRGPERFFTNVGLTVFGMIYMGLSGSLMLHLAMLKGTPAYYGVDDPNRGNQLLILFIASCKLGDVTAFFGGRRFGRHKMAPTISPGKTWEGFACSFVGAIGGAYLFTWLFATVCSPGPFNGWWQPAIWGLILGPLGVVGDLAESCMKRQAERKDSGTAIPGFGGFLDIFDALILAAPVAYVLALVL
jgi:CDP-diglyceride synthetase